MHMGTWTGSINLSGSQNKLSRRKHEREICVWEIGVGRGDNWWVKVVYTFYTHV